MKVSSALGGLAGACALTLLNEGVKKIDKDARQLDLLGMNSVARFMKGSNPLPAMSKQLFPTSTAGDLLASSLFYGMANAGTNKDTLLRGTLLGLGAGVGSLVLPKPAEMENRSAVQDGKTKALTIALYVIGGLVAAAVINLLDQDRLTINKSAT